MAIYGYNELNEMHIDTLREIGNIGAGNAATSLASMLSKKIDMGVSEVKILTYEDAVELMGGPETVVTGILVKLNEEIDGIIMFLLKKEFAHLVLNALMGTDLKNYEEITEMDISALSEIGNIMVASYINSIASLSGLKIGISVPSVTVDMAGAILSVCAVQFAEVADKVIFIKEKFFSEDEEIQSQMLLMPSMDSLNLLLGKLGIEI